MNALRTAQRSLLPLTVLLTFASEATAQFHFSIDYHGPTISLPDTAWGTPITEGDLLYPSTASHQPGPLPLHVPSIERTAGPVGGPGIDLGLAGYAACAGHAGGTPCTIEVDALSFGTDNPMSSSAPFPSTGVLVFSVDEFARGVLSPLLIPQVATEFPFGEAAADVFTPYHLVPGPLPPGAVAPINKAIFDGDGMASPSGFSYLGLGLVEPTFPVPAGLPSAGDDLDALDIQTPHGIYPVFFSLEGGLFDALTGGVGSNSAAFHGFVGADVLVTAHAGAAPTLYATANSLGLDLLTDGVDDLDALIIAENGIPGFQAPLAPNHWNTGQSDMLLFSVRRGSAVIGALDSLYGLPIEEGDILMPPIVGGLSPFPAIFFAAENLGLQTRRQVPGLQHGDDLDAADTRFSTSSDCDLDGVDDFIAIAAGHVPDCNLNGVPDSCDVLSGLEPDCNGNGVPDACEVASGTTLDCNGNGVPDSCDIANGTSLDLDLDGIPDVCGTGSTLCVGDGSVAPCPCGNQSAPGSGEGCSSSLGHGAVIFSTGSWGPLPNNFRLHIAKARATQPTVLVRGSSLIAVPFKDGLLCMGNPTQRVEVLFTHPSGYAQTWSPIGANPLSPGASTYFQFWYRDPGGVSPCGNGSNFTAAIRVP